MVAVGRHEIEQFEHDLDGNVRGLMRGVDGGGRWGGREGGEGGEGEGAVDFVFEGPGCAERGCWVCFLVIKNDLDES